MTNSANVLSTTPMRLIEGGAIPEPVIFYGTVYLFGGGAIHLTAWARDVVEAGTSLAHEASKQGLDWTDIKGIHTICPF